jgi:hypothetical protein
MALFVAGMWFQDLFNYDFRRTEMCIIRYGTQMGQISFCACNTGVGWRSTIEKIKANASVVVTEEDAASTITTIPRRSSPRPSRPPDATRTQGHEPCYAPRPHSFRVGGCAASRGHAWSDAEHERPIR